MNKLIITATIICAAVFANAASFNWMVYDEADKGLTTEGLKLYICSAGSTGFKNEGEVLAAVIGTDGNTGTLIEDTTYGGVYAVGGVSGISDTLDGQMQNFTYVIISGDGKGYWTFDGSSQVYITSYEHIDDSSDISAMLTTTYTPFSSGPTPVPEPTSGLLFVLGMAGLALRRRRA